jgi:hypothetical protein
MLPPHNITLGQVAHVGDAWFTAGFNHHPADVRPPQALVSVIRVEVGVGVSVMRTVTTGPPLDRTLDCASASHGKDIL